MLKSIIYSLLTKGSVAFINFLILVVSSKYLGVSSRGEISIFLLNIAVVQMLNEVYTGYSIIHFIPKFDLKRIILAGVGFTCVFCSLSNALIAFLNKQVAGQAWLGYAISLLVILNTFNCIILLGKEDLRGFNFLSFLQPILLFAGIIVYLFVFHVYTFKAYAWPLLYSFVAAFLISSFKVARLLKTSSIEPVFQLRPILAKGSVSQAALLMYLFVNRCSYYLLPDIADVGLYAAASSLMEALLFIANGIGPVLLARVANQGASHKSAELALTLGKLSFLISLLACLLIAAIPSEGFIFLLGNGFTGIRHLMLCYVPAILVISASGAFSYYFSAIGRQRLVLFCYGPGFCSTLLLAPFLISRFGTSGAALNACIAYTLIACSLVLVFTQLNGLNWKRFFSISKDYENLKDLLSPST